MKAIKVHLISGSVVKFKNAKVRYWDKSDTYGFRDKDTQEFLDIVPRLLMDYMEVIEDEQEV